MSKIFYISDMHFFHNNILNLANRPFQDIEEMHDAIIRNWKEEVGPKDIVYILGDLGMYHAKEITDIIRNLPGRKILITGNHDSKNLEYKNLRECFAGITSYKVINDNGRKVVLFHYPIEEWDGFYRGFYHIHGHIHDKIYSLEDIDNRFNASVDATSFRPRTLDWFINEQKDFLDNNNIGG